MSNGNGINRRELIQGGLFAATALGVRTAHADVLAAADVEEPAPARPADLSSHLLSVWIGCGEECLWEFRLHGSPTPYKFAPPAFPLDGKKITVSIDKVRLTQPPAHLRNAVTRYFYEGNVVAEPHLVLGIELEVNDHTPVIRFRYQLTSSKPRKLTKASAQLDLTYFESSLARFPVAKEINLCCFDGVAHSYKLSEEEVPKRAFQNGLNLMGPIVAATDGQSSFVMAYEHGSEAPDVFVQFGLSPDRRVTVSAVKGNYFPEQVVDHAHPFQTIWFQTGAVNGDLDQMASVYRLFVLNNLAQNLESRKPYIFYNTWNFQERNKWWHHKPYLESINVERIDREIDTAHRMGIDVFVIDTGWYNKTGDWGVNETRFPHGLKAVKAKLDGYGMKLGLWIGPTTAAVSSQIVREHPEWRASWNGNVYAPEPVWETEDSYHMCMVSGYSDALADKLIRVAKELGVSYFKWDWDNLSGCPCNASTHLHGNEGHTAEERFDSYRFQLIQRMCRTADRIAAAVPDIILEFDITEEGRPMGLGFLSSGKYFQINNGPYYFNYDVPIDKESQNWNLFFYQGQARTWITRSQLVVDKWIPSVLFLTHYFPDDPLQWQEVNVASLILGHNGIWGDLPSVSDAGVAYIGEALRRYKEVRDDITGSDPVTRGFVSGSPEIHEKISKKSGRGAVVIFATAAGKYSYITAGRVVDKYWASDGASVALDASHLARIDASFDKPGAKIVFFGCE